MDRKTALLSLALLGIAAPAFAGEIDEVATADLAATAAADDFDAEARNRRGGSTSRSSSSASRPSSSASRSSTAGRPAASSSRSSAPTSRSSAPTSRSSAPTSRSSAPTSRSSASPERTASSASRPSTGPSHPTAPPAGRPEAPSASSARTIVHPTPGRPGRTVVHTTPNRPGRTVVHTTPARPGRTVVHTTPARPGAVVHTRPGPTVVHRPVTHHAVVRPVHRHVTYTHVRPYHGVFVYGPRPVTHVTYVNETGPVRVRKDDLPEREVNRNESFAVGLKGGSMVGGTSDGVYSDPGLGLVTRYRPAETVGLELALSHHGSSVDPFNSRQQTQVAGSVELFAFPWTRVSPYALGGVTWNGSSIADDVWTGDTYESVADVSSQLGLHAGLGLELAMGKSLALDLEGRYIGWVSDSTPEVRTAPGALQATAGLLVHFR